MKCPQCQQDNAAHARFCLGCGARLALVCPACGIDMAAGARFCLQCGRPVADPGVASVSSRAPSAYTPRHLAVKILTSKSALEGERKHVTVLFADLKGSMELLADRDPEEARKILDPVLERMMEAVHRYEGTVNQVMGDGIMALFGAPLAHEDHAVRACYAALRMQEAVKRYGEQVRHAQGVTVRIRVGLNSGEVVVRAIGSDLHMDYTAVGQTTHLAARMEQLADPGSILLTPDTLQLAEGYLEVKPLGSVPVRGLVEPIEVFELTGAGAVCSRLHAVAARGLTRFVGRDAELDQLGQALESASTGHGQVVAVVGEPGVGKSRLSWELTHSHRTEGWLILEAGSVSYGRSTAYLPVVDLLKRYFQIDARDDARRIREKATGKLLALDRQLEPWLPALLALLDIALDDPQWERLDPPQRRQRTLEGVKRLLLRESQVQPLLVLFEDLHWIDSESQAALNSLVESLPTGRILLLVSYRPEYQHGWGSKSYYMQLRIDPLPQESAEELIRAILGDDPKLASLTQLLIKRTGGNPFFLEESVRALVETHALTGERGAHRLARPVDTIKVPATVQAGLAARIDRLPTEAKRLLQSAAVIGHEVPFAILHSIAELPEDPLRQGLAHLQAAEFLQEVRIFPEPEYAFKHQLTHEVAYTGLLHERRRALHVKVMQAIEQLYPGRMTEHIERLARHALRGEVWGKAVTYLRQAARKASARSAYREAVSWLDQALAANARRPVPDSGDSIDIRVELRHSLVILGEYGRIIDILRDAEVAAGALGDERRLGRVCSSLGHGLWVTGAPDVALEYFRRAVDIAQRTGDTGLESAVSVFLGQTYHVVGDYRRGLDVLEKALATLRRHRSETRLGPLQPVICLTWIVWCLAELGDFGRARALGEEALSLAAAADHKYALALAYLGLGRASLQKGDVAEALDLLDRGFALCVRWDLAAEWGATASLLGLAYVRSGRLSEAVPLMAQAAERATAMGINAYMAERFVGLGEACLSAGEVNQALEHATRGLELSRRHGEHGHEAWALRLMADASSCRAGAEAQGPEALYRQAARHAEDLGMRPLVAHCHLGLGKLYRRTGKRQEAQEHLTAAATMYREMDMRSWLEKAEAGTAT